MPLSRVYYFAAIAAIALLLYALLQTVALFDPNGSSLRPQSTQLLLGVAAVGGAIAAYLIGVLGYSGKSLTAFLPSVIAGSFAALAGIAALMVGNYGFAFTTVAAVLAAVGMARIVADPDSMDLNIGPFRRLTIIFVSMMLFFLGGVLLNGMIPT